VLDYFGEVLSKGTEAQAAQNKTKYEEASTALRSKWGLAYEEKMKTANSVLQNFVGDGKNGKEIAAKYGNDPLIIELLANVGANLNEESLSRVGMTGTMLTPEAAQLEINKIKMDTGHPYMNAQHPDHKFWVDRMNTLYQMAGG
jgi:hypothetical protein